MTAHITPSSSKLDRELSDLCGDVLELSSTEQARSRVLSALAQWFSLDQSVWVLEPRSLELPIPGSFDFLSLLNPVKPSLFDPMMAYRHHNPLLRAMISQADMSPICPTHVQSRRDWSRNPFHHEVCAQMGMREMMAVEVPENTSPKNDIFAVVMGRDRGAFSLRECGWFDRVRWSLKPLMKHLRLRESRMSPPNLTVPASALTPREKEVFHWMGQGKRNKEIAIIIKCAPRTVEKHVESILRKTNTETRSSAVRTCSKS